MNDLMISQDPYIYVISGYMEHTLFSVEWFSIMKGTWQHMSNVNIARTKFGIVHQKSKNKIYALGGKLQDASWTELVEEYDITLDKWTTSNWTLPKPRSGFATCIVNDSKLINIRFGFYDRRQRRFCVRLSRCIWFIKEQMVRINKLKNKTRRTLRHPWPWWQNIRSRRLWRIIKLMP